MKRVGKRIRLVIICLIAGFFLQSSQYGFATALDIGLLRVELRVPNPSNIMPILRPTYSPIRVKMMNPPTVSSKREMVGCNPPKSDYSIVHIKGMLLNMRTYTMLQYAAQLYQKVCGNNPCPIDITGKAITQGSYNNSVPESFGTHTGGGAVDISVISQNSPHFTILYAEINPLIHALRLAGFAAWFRDLGEVGPGSPVHIHAIAIGDKHLSPSARDQLDGTFGYFRGFNWLPNKKGVPKIDPHSGPIICGWMLKSDFRGSDKKRSN